MTADPALRARLEAECLAGLRACAAAFAGDDLVAVLAGLDGSSLPWPAAGVFGALAGLDVPPPAAPAADVLRRFLIGGERDAAGVVDALAVVSDVVRRPAPPPLPEAGPQLAHALLTRSLVGAVAEVWAALCRVYADERAHAVAGDVEALAARLGVAVHEPVEARDRLDFLAQRLATSVGSGLAPGIWADPRLWVAPVPARVASRAGTAIPPATAESDVWLPVMSGDAAAAPAPPPPRAGARARHAPNRRSHERPLAPVMFLLAVVLLAAAWLAAIARGSAPFLP